MTSSSGTIRKITLPSTTIFGQKTVTTNGTEVTLGTTQALLSGVTVKAENANTGLIYVGTGTFSSTDGFELAAGEQIFIEIDDIASVSVDASVSGEGVRYIGS